MPDVVAGTIIVEDSCPIGAEMRGENYFSDSLTVVRIGCCLFCWRRVGEQSPQSN